MVADARGADGTRLGDVARALQRQTVDHWEWLLLGAAEDQSGDVTSDERIRVLETTDRESVGAARNRALREASSDLVVILDPADCLEPTVLETWAWLLTTQPHVALADAIVAPGDGAAPDRGGVAAGWERLEVPPAIRTYALRRTAVVAAGGFDESLPLLWLDWDVALRVAASGAWGSHHPYVIGWRPSAVPAPSRHETEDFLTRWHRRAPELFENGAPECEVHLDVHELPRALVRSPPVRARAAPRPGRHVVAVAPWLRVGGSERALLEVLQQLRSRGWSATVVATADHPHDWLEDFRAVADGDVLLAQQALNPTRFPAVVSTEPAFLLEVVRSRDADLVLLSNSELGLGCVPLLRRERPGMAVAELRHAVYWPTLSVDATRGLDLTLASSEAVRDALLESGADPRTTVAYSTCVDHRRFRPDPDARSAIRERHAIPQDAPLVVVASRMSLDKQVVVAVRVVERLRARGHDVRALIVGSGPQEGEVREAAAEPGIAGAVEILGHIDADDVPRYLAAADVCLLPSIAEGIALVAFESLASGVPFVGARVGAQHELVTPDVGVLVTPTGTAAGDTEAYASVLECLLADPQRLRAMGAAGRARIEHGYTLDRMGEQVAREIENGLVRASSRGGRIDEDAAWASAALAVQVDYWQAQWRARDHFGRQDLATVNAQLREVEAERDAARASLAERTVADSARRSRLATARRLAGRVRGLLERVSQRDVARRGARDH